MDKTIIKIVTRTGTRFTGEYSDIPAMTSFSFSLPGEQCRGIVKNKLRRLPDRNRQSLRYLFLSLCFLLALCAVSALSVPGVSAQTSVNEAALVSDEDSTSAQSGEESALTLRDFTQEEKPSSSFQLTGEGQLNFFGLIAKTIGYFLLIVILIFVTVFMLKRFVYNRKELSARGKAIHVLTSTYVGPKKSLLLVEAAGRILILSVTDTQMNLITELRKEEYEEYLKHPGKRESNKPLSESSGSQFGELLNKILKRPK